MKKAGSTDKGLFSLGTLSVAFGGGVEEVGWGVSKPNRAASYTARLGSGQEAGVGAGPGREPWKRGGWIFGGCGGKRRSLEDGGQQRGRVEWG